MRTIPSLEGQRRNSFKLILLGIASLLLASCVVPTEYGLVAPSITIPTIQPIYSSYNRSYSGYRQSPYVGRLSIAVPTCSPCRGSYYKTRTYTIRESNYSNCGSYIYLPSGKVIRNY